jgi:hypothetical protein
MAFEFADRSRLRHEAGRPGIKLATLDMIHFIDLVDGIDLWP